MARPELGTKRTCLECGAKFYDLMRSPIFCPKCGSEFQLATPVSPATASKATPAEEEDEEEDTTTSGPEIISLEEADAEQGADEDIPEIEGEDDVEDIGEVNEDAFLEDDDDDDNVPFIPEVGGSNEDES